VKKVYFFSFLVGVLAIALAMLFSSQDAFFIKKFYFSHIYNQRATEINTIITEEKQFLNSFAKFLVNTKIVKEAYLENNRTKLINFVLPLYKALHPKYIEEIHFFKPPVVSFVNFANLNVYNVDGTKARNDILWVYNSFKPSTHFYVCRLYPGLRATYPIIYKGKVIGSLSFGVSMNQILNVIRELKVKNVSLYLNDSTLKTFLNPNIYKKYEEYPLYKGFRVFGNVFPIKLAPGYEYNGKSLFTKIELKDFFNNVFGYIVVEDSVATLIDRIKLHLVHLLIVGIIVIIFGFLIITYIFNYFKKKYIQNSKIIELIKKREFSKIPKKVKPKDISDEYTNALIDLAEDISMLYNVLHKKLESYENKAYKDFLTKTFNRNFLEEKAKELLYTFKIKYDNVGVIMIDIDNFKKINDTYGHSVGDIVLIELAKTIRHIIRKEDIFIRYGGEEFVIFLPNSDIENTFRIAEKIRKTIENLKITINDKVITFTISAGISEIRQDDTSIFDAINRADENLYKAKRNGKNRVEL